MLVRYYRPGRPRTEIDGILQTDMPDQQVNRAFLHTIRPQDLRRNHDLGHFSRPQIGKGDLSDHQVNRDFLHLIRSPDPRRNHVLRHSGKPQIGKYDVPGHQVNQAFLRTTRPPNLPQQTYVHPRTMGIIVALPTHVHVEYPSAVATASASNAWKVNLSVFSHRTVLTFHRIAVQTSPLPSKVCSLSFP